MKILHLLSSGNIGGIESLCRDIGLNSNDNGFCFLFGDGMIYDQMKEKGLVTYSLKDENRKINRIKWKKLCLIADQYDVIVVHHGDPILKFYYYMLTRKISKKFITVVHSCFEEKYFYPNNRLKNILGKMIFQSSLSVSDRVIFVSNAGKKSYDNAFNISPEKCCVVYNGIGKDKLIAGRETKTCLPEIYNISYIGRLNHVKGIDLLINAVGMLVAQYPIHLSIIGDGDIRKDLEQQVHTSGLSSYVTFYGKQLDVIPFLKRTDIFVYPSVWQEVFGISVVEAMAFGKLCVVNSVGGLPEIINDGINGFITEDVSAEKVAKGIERAILSYKDGSFSNISEEARKTAESFSIGNTVNNFMDICESVMLQTTK